MRLFFCCVCLLLGPVATLFPIPTNSVQADILAQEQAWNKAELNHDAAALARLLADDFVLTEPDGSVLNKTEEVAFTADAEVHFEIEESSNLKVHVYSDAAVVTGAYYEKGTYHGKPFEHRGRFTDAWVRRGDTWQCVASHFSVPVPDSLTNG
jgi:ketosteroid isomerase-like protein